MPLSSLPHVRAVVLAAGSGSRLGAPKALLRDGTGGETWLERAVDTVLTGGCEGATIVIGAAADEVRHALGRSTTLDPGIRIDVVECADWREGMGASLRAGLRHLQQVVAVADAARGAVPGAVPSALSGAVPDAALVMLVDLPDVGPAVVRRLLTKASDHESPLAAGLSRAAYQGRVGHPALIGRDHWAGVVAAARGDHGARTYFATHTPVLVECGDLATGRDVDSLSDLDR